MSKLKIPGTRLDREYESIRDELDPAIAQVIRRGVFAPHVEVEALEREFAQYIGVRHAVAVGSGFAALISAFMALPGISGGEIISVPNVDVSASAPITHAGARPVWTDIDPRTYNLNPAGLEDRITAKTRAIDVVHMYGNPADMDPILEIADRHQIPVVEDASLGPGATYHGRKVGGIGCMGCFSFCAGKVLGAMGRAGIVVTNQADLAERVRVISNYGYEPSSFEVIVGGVIGVQFVAQTEGFNFVMDELQAAVLRVKLRHLDEWLERRRENAAIYRQMLADLEPEHLLLPIDTPGTVPVYRMFVIRTPRRDQLQAHLKDAGVWSGLAYVPPLHVQPAYRYLGYAPGSFPWTERVTRELLCLPTVPQLSTQEVEAVGETVRRFFLS